MQLTVKNRAFIALLLCVPATSLGAIMSLLVAPGTLGQTVLVACQAWLIYLPVAWLRWVEHKPIKVSRPTRSDWKIGAVVGLLMFSIILAAYWLLLKDWIDVIAVRGKLQQLFDIDKTSFLLGGIYFILINALIEEYFWRWFIYSRCEELVSKKIAVPLSALFFTFHHTIALAVFTNWRVSIVGSLAVFAAGTIWSEYYRRRRSVWSNYLSHAIADLALHIVAWQVFFG